jgi:cell division protein FtsI/penicillin-binding protein 2
MAEGPKRRLILLNILLIGALLVIVAQLVQVQIVKHRFYTEWAKEQRIRAVTMAEPPRGVIRDRNGYLLAGNAVIYSIEAAPAYVSDKDHTAASLSPILHMPESNIKQKLDSDTLWVQLTSSVSPEAKDRLEELNLPGVTARPKWLREYPEGALASHVLGFYSAAERGYYGIEGFYDPLLQPQQVEREGPVDSANSPIPWAAAPVTLPQQGTELVLTLNRTVQAIVEEELTRAVQEHRAEKGTIIVMDPRTFEILAMASLPEYNPDKYAQFADDTPCPFEDPAISQQYEPGSVFKILTVAAAIESGLVTPETTYYDPGETEIGGQIVRNASPQSYGEHTVAEILIESLNVGAVWLSKQVGPERFYRYVQAFGVGRPTGVDLAGEIAGQLWLPDDAGDGSYENWHISYLGVNSFGQGVAVTPLQMITAVATVANDGVRLRPHIVKQRIAPDGTVSTFQSTVEAQVIAPQTAHTLMEILVRVVEEEVHQAEVDGYRVAGKTGTAQIPIASGYEEEDTITSFVGFGPVPDPQLVILVKLDRPQTSTWASKTAAPVFQRLATRLFTVLNIPPGETQTLAEIGQ